MLRLQSLVGGQANLVSWTTSKRTPVFFTEVRSLLFTFLASLICIFVFDYLTGVAELGNGCLGSFFFKLCLHLLNIVTSAVFDEMEEMHTHWCSDKVLIASICQKFPFWN